MHFRSDIQGLRAVAFLLVFIFHLNSGWLPGGFLGVDIFFVISGYLMTSIILHQKEKKTLKLYGIICLNVARPRFFKERKYQFYKIRFIYLKKFSEKSNTEGGCLTYLAQGTTSQ